MGNKIEEEMMFYYNGRAEKYEEYKKKVSVFLPMVKRL